MSKVDTIPQAKKENHKQRAYLNSVTSILDYAGLQITGFIVSPFIVGGLGNSLYGIYQVLNQMTGYANMADTRASQVLKWTIAQKREVASKEELRNELTTALVVTSLILPLIMLLGGLLVWFSPIITQAEEQYHDLIRIASALMILSLIIYKVFDVFEALLRGMNLGFKGMGIRSVVVAVGGLLKVLVITQGFGLIGLSIVQVVIGLATGIIFYLIVKKNVAWFGFGTTNKKMIISYSKLSGWFMGFSFSNMLLLNSDKILLGFLLGPESVTIYVLTIFSIKAMEGIINAVVSGIIPGVGKFFGNNEFEKVKQARRVMMSIMWIGIGAFGVSIIIFNQSFLYLWMGEGMYAGHLENLLFLFISIQYIFFNLDGTFINVTLDMKTKVLLSTVSSVLTVLLAFLLVEDYFIGGMCVSLLFGRLILTFGYPYILKSKMKESLTFFDKDTIQPLLATIFVFSVAYYFCGWVFIISDWFYLIGLGIGVFLITGFVMWHLGLSPVHKREVIAIVSKVRFLNKITN